jgi:hypothetical protein
MTGLAGSPTVQSRGYAMVSVAMFDAANATLNKPNRSYFDVPSVSGDTRAAVSVAAHDVLVHLNPAKAAEFDAALSASLALVGDGQAKLDGIATGAAFAAAVITGRAADGSNVMVPYPPTGLPGNWSPTPPGFGSPALPQYANVTPWLMTSPSEFTPGPPPALDSAEYTAAHLEVMELGALASASRTPEQTEAAHFWASAAGNAPWVRAGIDQAQINGLSTLENAELFALLATGIADAVIATWNAKYDYDYWRPITAIQNAGIDGNPNKIGDPSWASLINAPAHPSYVSAHAAVAGAASAILEAQLGVGDPFCLTAAATSSCWDTFADAAQDAADSRLWGGIHWRFDNEAGLDLGRTVALNTIGDGRFGAAVPEPSTWALMLIGFGLIGGALRRPRRRVAIRYA